jgi:glutaredoxin
MTNVVPRITLYTKPECGLCDEMKDVIDAVRRKHSLELELRNILENLHDYEKYKHDIPVVLLNGVEIARHRMTEDQLEFALQSRRIQ